MKNQKGFSVIEGLLILVIVGMLGGIGWYVLDKAGNTSTTPQYSKKQTDPTADWVAYSNKEGDYSLRYPKSWVTASNLKSCEESGLLMLGTDSASAGACATEGAGQITIFSFKNLPIDTQKLEVEGYQQISTEEVTVDGVKGIKQSGIAQGQDKYLEVGALDDGTKVVIYIFQKGVQTYVATYAQRPSYKDVLSDFNLMITETLKFSS